MPFSAHNLRLAELRIFANTLYYGFGDLTDLSQDDDDPALKQYELIAPCIEDGVSQKTRAAETGVSRKTIGRLIEKFAGGGIEALRRKTRSDKGRARVSNNTFNFIKGKLLTHPQLSFATIHRQLNRLNAHASEFTASYQQIRRVRQALNEDLIVLARSEQEFEETRELLIRHEAAFPNEMWQCDHKFLDIFVWDNSRNEVKPVLTAVIDDYSRAIMGYYLDLDPPSAQRTAITLRQAIWKKENPNWLVCGIPDVLYTDRGSDFRSTRIQQIAAELGFKLSKRRSGKPQGGGKIERFFGTVNQLLMSELPGFTPEDEPAAAAGMTIQQLQKTFDEWIIAEYMHRVHGETGETPFDRWSNHHQHPRLAPSFEVLDVLLMTVPDDRMVQQDGVRIFNLRYDATEFRGLIGKYVTARYDPRDISEVLVYLDDKFVCRATCSEIADKRPSLKELMRARNEYKRELRKEIKSSIEFAASFPEALRKIAAAPPIGRSSQKIPFKLKRYQVDE
ncbi:MAG: DDE-type integrase/transposase/recombinase [Candidatus Melainabacteria bacterium]|nr:DDE-type integrase/transposase/recombinase [Candidatus Melainabacteria bacterium]